MPYPPEFTLFFWLVFSGALIFTGIGFWLAKQYQLLPAIRDRDVHTTRKPRIGGLAMWLVIVLAIFLIATSSTHGYFLDFGNSRVFGIDRALWGIIAGLFVLLIVGLVDDLFDLKPVPAVLIGSVY